MTGRSLGATKRHRTPHLAFAPEPMVLHPSACSSSVLAPAKVRFTLVTLPEETPRGRLTDLAFRPTAVLARCGDGVVSVMSPNVGRPVLMCVRGKPVATSRDGRAVAPDRVMPS